MRRSARRPFCVLAVAAVGAVVSAQGSGPQGRGGRQGQPGNSDRARPGVPCRDDGSSPGALPGTRQAGPIDRRLPAEIDGGRRGPHGAPGRSTRSSTSTVT